MQTGVERNLPAEQRRVEKVEFRGKGVKKNEKQKNYCAVLGIVLTLGLVVSGCGNSGTSSDGSAKAETKKDGYQVVNIGFPSAGYQWAEGALAVAEEKDIWMNI